MSLLPFPFRRKSLTFLLLLGALHASAQDNGGRLSGSFQANVNFFQRDSAIGAANTPGYDRQLLGNEAWLNLDYSQRGFDVGLRFDLFNNTNLFNPLGSYSGLGIGRWYIRKQVGKLHLSGGHIYDQIGSGIIFRSYEARPLAIDNALIGARAAWQLNENWQVKAFSGKQRNVFSFYNPVISGAAVEGYVALRDGAVSLVPGAGIVMRTTDDATMDQIVASIETYTPVDSFIPKYNTRAVTLYNTLNAGNFTWYIEGAYKTADVFYDPATERTFWDGSTALGRYVSRPGNVVYTSLGYNTGGLGVILEAKRTQDFSFRVDPFVNQLRGMVNFLPPMSRVNTYRLTARYNAATQEIGETAGQASIRYTVNDELSLGLDYSQIMDLDAQELFYREVYPEITWKPTEDWNIVAGVQHQWYNQFVYEGKTGALSTITPFSDIQYSFDDTRALRMELSTMFTGQVKGMPEAKNRDYGNWLFALLEFTIAPHWTFTAADMWNYAPARINPRTGNKEKSIHYPRFDVFYTTGPSRFALSYIKQVDGIVCTGGICRYEPAFSGFRLNMQTNF